MLGLCTPTAPNGLSRSTIWHNDVQSAPPSGRCRVRSTPGQPDRWSLLSNGKGDKLCELVCYAATIWVKWWWMSIHSEVWMDFLWSRPRFPEMKTNDDGHEKKERRRKSFLIRKYYIVAQTLPRRRTVSMSGWRFLFFSFLFLLDSWHGYLLHNWVGWGCYAAIDIPIDGCLNYLGCKWKDIFDI